MQCSACRSTLVPSASICSNCGRFTDERIEQRIEQIAALSRSDMAAAKQLFQSTLKAVRPADQNYFRQRTAYAMGQLSQPPRPPQPAQMASEQPAAPVSGRVEAARPKAAASSAGVENRPPPNDRSRSAQAVPAAAISAAAVSAASASKGAASKSAASKSAAPKTASSSSPAAQPPRDVAQAPPNRPSPPAGKGTQTIFMDFNQSPREIVRVMGESQKQAAHFSNQRKWLRRLILLLFPVGALFLLVDRVLAFNSFTCSLAAVTLWVWAVIGLLLIRARGKPPTFGPQYQVAQTVIETLKDDVSRKRTLIGWLDLSGAEQTAKKYRSKSSPSGRPVSYYRDEWLRFKARLADGSVLRLAIVEQRKVREGFWKTGTISGKRKFKAGSSASQHQLQVAISVAPGSYQIHSFDSRNPAVPDSRFAIEEVDAGNGVIKLKAVANQAFDAWDVLHTLRYAYDHLQPAAL